MSLASLNSATLADAQRQFEDALPLIERVLRFNFRRWPGRRRDDALAAARAAAWSAWCGLVRRGLDPYSVGITGIAYNAVRNVRQGRRLGNTPAGRGAMDIHHARARRRCGLRIYSLDSNGETLTRRFLPAWEQWTVADNRCSPADEAAFRLDLAAWLDILPPRKRQMAELLALGHETGVVARVLDVTPGAVSQTRAWLGASWAAFQTQCLAD